MLHTATRDTYEAEVLAASGERAVLVDFWGPRCVPCLQMMPWVEELAQRAGSALKVVKVNAAENRRLCVHLRVLGLPTFILYRDGVELRRLSGDACTPETIAATLREFQPDLVAAGAVPASSDQ